MTTDNKVDKKGLEVKNRYFKELAEIVELFPRYTITEHHEHILKKRKFKGIEDDTDKEDSYYWSNEKLLKKTERYRYILEEEVVDDINQPDEFLN